MNDARAPARLGGRRLEALRRARSDLAPVGRMR